MKRKEMRSKGLICAMTLLAFVVGTLAFGFFQVNEAQALRVSMKRIIFEGPKRSDILTIMNNSPKEQTFRLGWKHYRMDENRSLIGIKDGEEKSTDIKWADDMIRYAPRRVTVPAGGSQQVRLLLRRPRDLPEGEYRSHLWIITEAEAQDFVTDEARASPGQQSFQLAMMPALTLPVFVRHGDLSVSSKITNAKLSSVDGGGSVSFELHREGGRSLYGDVNIYCTAGSDDYLAHFVRGIAVYTEVSKRLLDFDFTYPPERAADCRTVRVEYVADKTDSKYSGQVIAQAVASQ